LKSHHKAAAPKIVIEIVRGVPSVFSDKGRIQVLVLNRDTPEGAGKQFQKKHGRAFSAAPDRFDAVMDPGLVSDYYKQAEKHQEEQNTIC
jgi:hypothetical protein